MQLVLCIAVLTLMQGASASRIFMLFPMPSFSHYTLAHRLAEGLVEKGHEVTLMASYIQDSPANPLFHQILIEGLADIVREKKKVLLHLEAMLPIRQIMVCYHLGYAISEFTMSYKPLLDLVATKKGYFDVMILEQFYDESLAVFAHELEVPLMHFSTLMPSMWVNHLVGNPAPASYVPNVFLRHNGHMDFFARMHNALTNLAEELYRRLIAFPYHERLVHATYPNAPTLNNLLYTNTTFVLANSHHSTGEAIPGVPNLVEIGGFHVKTADMPADLQPIMDNAKHGVVLFSMGSNLKSCLLPTQKLAQIQKALGRLNQTVLWKWEEDHMEGKPENVVVRKWLPQQAILAHPKTKAFVSHGGMLSTIEAATFGKPVVGIPMYADQVINIRLAVNRGYAKEVPFRDLNEDSLYEAISTVVNNASYITMAKWRSKAMRDRLVHPLQEAIYWVEYVIRHKGANHMRSTAMDLKWYQYNLLDVIAFLLAVIVSALMALIYIIKSRFTSHSRQKLPNKKHQ